MMMIIIWWICSGISTKWLFIHWLQIELEFRRQCWILWREENWRTHRKTLRASWEPTTNSTHIWHQWWQVSALTTVQSLLPRFPWNFVDHAVTLKCVFRYIMVCMLSSCSVYTKLVSYQINVCITLDKVPDGYVLPWSDKSLDRLAFTCDSSICSWPHFVLFPSSLHHCWGFTKKITPKVIPELCKLGKIYIKASRLKLFCTSLWK